MLIKNPTHCLLQMVCKERSQFDITHMITAASSNLAIQNPSSLEWFCPLQGHYPIFVVTSFFFCNHFCLRGKKYYQFQELSMSCTVGTGHPHFQDPRRAPWIFPEQQIHVPIIGITPCFYITKIGSKRGSNYKDDDDDNNRSWPASRNSSNQQGWQNNSSNHHCNHQHNNYNNDDNDNDMFQECHHKHLKEEEKITKTNTVDSILDLYQSCHLLCGFWCCTG